MRRALSAVVTLSVLLWLPAMAKSEELVRYIGKARAPLCNTPGGPKRGELFISAPVQLLEERGGWAKVRVEGWVRRGVLKETSGKQIAKGGTLIEKGDTKLTIESFEIKKRDTGDKKLAVLKLKLKNNTKKTIQSWRALLVAQTGQGRVLFREPVTEEGKAVAPGALHDVSFYWTEDEAAYGALLAYRPSELQLKLFRVFVE